MAAKEISDTKTLSWHPHHTRLNFEFMIDDGGMTEYMIQLEYNDGSYADPDWCQVARFDSTHGFFHLDLYHSDGTKRKIWKTLPQNLSESQEFDKARSYLVRNSTELIRKNGYVED